MAKKEFKSESKRLLDLMINSIYTHKEIFLRELISNASDAIDKLCFIALTDDKLNMSRDDFKIFIKPDKENRTLTITDNGIGMDKDDLENNLGTIASSGSYKFKQEMSEKQAVNEPCRVLHNGSVNSFLHSFTSALKLQERRRIINILQYIGVGISVILMAMFSFISGLSQAGAVQIILFETLWTLVVAFAPKIKKI